MEDAERFAVHFRSCGARYRRQYVPQRFQDAKGNRSFATLQEAANGVHYKSAPRMQQADELFDGLDGQALNGQAFIARIPPTHTLRERKGEAKATTIHLSNATVVWKRVKCRRSSTYRPHGPATAPMLKARVTHCHVMGDMVTVSATNSGDVTSPCA